MYKLEDDVCVLNIVILSITIAIIVFVAAILVICFLWFKHVQTKKIMAGYIEMDNTLDIELLTSKLTFKNKQADNSTATTDTRIKPT